MTENIEYNDKTGSIISLGSAKTPGNGDKILLHSTGEEYSTHGVSSLRTGDTCLCLGDFKGKNYILHAGSPFAGIWASKTGGINLFNTDFEVTQTVDMNKPTIAAKYNDLLYCLIGDQLSVVDLKTFNVDTRTISYSLPDGYPDKYKLIVTDDYVFVCVNSYPLIIKYDRGTLEELDRLEIGYTTGYFEYADNKLWVMVTHYSLPNRGTLFTVNLDTLEKTVFLIPKEYSDLYNAKIKYSGGKLWLYNCGTGKAPIYDNYKQAMGITEVDMVNGTYSDFWFVPGYRVYDDIIFYDNKIYCCSKGIPNPPQSGANYFNYLDYNIKLNGQEWLDNYMNYCVTCDFTWFNAIVYEGIIYSVALESYFNKIYLDNLTWNLFVYAGVNGWLVYNE